MSEANTHKSKLSTLKTLLLLAPVFFVWIEIALPIMVAPLFSKNDQSAFVFSFLGLGIYLIYTYIFIIYSIKGIKGPNPIISKKLIFATYVILTIIILAGIHSGTMIFQALSNQNLNLH